MPKGANKIVKTRSAFLILLTLAILSPAGLAVRLVHGTGVACNSSKTVLLIQDITPWASQTNHDPNGADANELMTQQEGFCMINSNQVETTNLARFTEIIIPSAQDQAYYDNLFPDGTILSEISSWVQDGGVLSANLADCASAPGAGGGWSSSACTSTASSYTFVGGVQHIGSFSDDNDIASSSSPVVTGDNGQTNGGQIGDDGCLTDLDCWGFSSHSYFTNLPSDTTVILTEPNGPVFIEYRHGDGLVIATTTSIEWRYDYFQTNFQNLKLLANEIGYQHFRATCQEKDGEGDFNGNKGKGHFHFDKDHCKDEDPEGVWASDRGDGNSFQSTEIQSAQFDPTIRPRSITITGLGTVIQVNSLGVSVAIPVAFTFVAVEAGPTTPGLVSFVFSDGYSNAGSLTSGSVLLHGW